MMLRVGARQREVLATDGSHTNAAITITRIRQHLATSTASVPAPGMRMCSNSTCERQTGALVWLTTGVMWRSSPTATTT